MSDQNDDPLSIANLGRWLGRRRPAAAPAASRPAVARPEQAISSSALVALFAHASAPLELLHAFAAGMRGLHGELGDMGERLETAYERQDWPAYGRAMRQLIDKYVRTVVLEHPQGADAPHEADQLRELLRAMVGVALPPLLADHPELAADARAADAALADWQPGGSLEALARELKSLAQRIDIRQRDPGRHDFADLLRVVLGTALLPLLEGVPELAAEARRLDAAVADWQPGGDLDGIARDVRALAQRVDIRAHEGDEQRDLLIDLFNLLLENVSELLDDHSWLHGQIDAVRDLIARPVEREDIDEARDSLREAVYRQGLLKQGITESKSAMKEMMTTFVDNLDGMATSTGEYHDRIAGYSLAIRNARSVADFNKLIDEALQDTRRTQERARLARDEMLAARDAADAAETRVRELEQELQRVNGLIRCDQLTGALNRRGLEDRFAREVQDAHRQNQPLSLVMLDVDDFRLVNTRFGHPGGDAVLRHLVELARNTLRAVDTVARFGGEEFVILMPNATLYEARASVARIQQNLVLRPPQFEGQRITLTFSGGVAECRRDETLDDVVKRADTALYQAKQAGKNCVVSAG